MLTTTAKSVAAVRPQLSQRAGRQAAHAGVSSRGNAHFGSSHSSFSARRSIIARAPAGDTDSHYGMGEKQSEKDLIIEISGREFTENDEQMIRGAVAFAGDPTTVTIEGGKAVVEFGTLDEASDAINLNGKELDDGTKVTVNVPKSA